MPELDALRGLAAFMVVFYHGFHWSNKDRVFEGWGRAVVSLSKVGWTGVDLFFVLSGFLISGILLDSKAKSTRRYYADFYVRRARRILPLYYLVLAVASIMLAIDGQMTWDYFLVAVFFMVNFAELLGVGAGYPVSVFWTLAIEEHFYLVWPTIVRFLDTRRVFGLCLLICALSPLARWLQFQSSGEDVAYVLSWYRLDSFCWGVALACGVRLFSRPKLFAFAWAATCILAACCLILLGKNAGIITRTTSVGAGFQATLVSMLYSSLIAVALLAGSLFANTRLPGGGILIYLGKISYCLYLINLLAFWCFDKLVAATGYESPTEGGSLSAWVTFRFLVVLAASMGFSELSRRYFESRFRQVN